MATTAKELERLVVRLVGEGSEYRKVLDNAVKETKAASRKIEQLTDRSMGAQNKAMLEAARITEAAAKPAEKYKRKVAELDKHYKAGRISGETYRRTLKSINKEHSKGVYAAAAFGGKLKSIGRSMGMFGMMAGMAVTLPVAGMVKSFASFDDAMTKSTAIMSDVTPELRAEMEATARSISLNSVTSSKDLAESYFFLASAGMNAKQSIAALGVVEKFAVAGAFDMAQATDLLTDAQSALGLSSGNAEKNMEGLLKVSDTLVKANTLANASVSQFSQALTSGAGTAIKQYNMDLEEGVAILATYADKGMKANLAGGMFDRMTRLTIKSINDNREAFERLNIPIDEFANTGKNITAVIGGITKATEGMGPAQKAATLEMLGFEARSQQAILPLLGMTENIRGYEAELRKAGGTTQQVADKQLTSFSAEMKILWNNVKDVGMTIGQALVPAVKSLADKIMGLTEWFKGLSSGTQATIAVIVGLAAALGPIAMILGPIVGLIGNLLIAVPALTTAFAALGTVMTAHPIIALATVATGATLSVGKLITEVWKLNEANKALASSMEGLAWQEDNAWKKFGMSQAQIEQVNKERRNAAIKAEKDLRASQAKASAPLEEVVKKKNLFADMFEKGMDSVTDSFKLGALTKSVKEALDKAMTGTGSISDVTQAVHAAMSGMGSKEQAEQFLKNVQSMVSETHGGIGKRETQDNSPRFAGAMELGSQAAMSAINRHKFGMTKEKTEKDMLKEDKKQTILLGEVVTELKNMEFPDLEVETL